MGFIVAFTYKKLMIFYVRKLSNIILKIIFLTINICDIIKFVILLEWGGGGNEYVL